jgi:hypothetical protein
MCDAETQTNEDDFYYHDDDEEVAVDDDVSFRDDLSFGDVALQADDRMSSSSHLFPRSGKFRKIDCSLT